MYSIQVTRTRGRTQGILNQIKGQRIFNNLYLS